jgi:hypothetical protein
VFVVESVGDGDVHVIPTVIAPLVAADQQYGAPPRVECIEYAQWPPIVLDPQLAHMRVLGAEDLAAIRCSPPLDVLGVDAVVLRVRANEFDENDAGVVRDGRNQPVPVALDVEDDATVTENAGIAKLRLDTGRGFSSNRGLMRWPY